MATIGLELADAALLAVRDGAEVAASPGVVLFAPAGLVAGAAAAAAARLRPALVVDRHWSELSAEIPARPGVDRRTHADLAAAQLAALWREIGADGDVLALAVPGTLRLRQLGLVLGITRHLGIPVAGSVDAAVAACADLAARATVLHLDLHFHQAVLTVLDGAQRLRRQQVAVTPHVGLRALHAVWAQLVSDAMVRSTRFDPLHEAATEQRLHDLLPEWLAALHSAAEVEAVLTARSGGFAVTVSRAAFVTAAEAYYTQLIELVQAHQPAGATATLALSARAAGLPGLADRLAESPGIEVTRIARTAAADGAARHLAGNGAGSEPTLMIALPRAHSLAPAQAAPPQRGPLPTHVLLGGRAHALAAGPLVLGAAPGAGRTLTLSAAAAGLSRRHCTLEARSGTVVVRDHSRFGTFVNGARVEGEAPLVAGDRLRLGTPGVVLELVAVD
ncbi:MAG: FHA domain-containing protein [Gammaproteobacteria bacterium]|nr:FHA domain-containing protein [Gammaproteobacteria bacterium]